MKKVLLGVLAFFNSISFAQQTIDDLFKVIVNNDIDQVRQIINQNKSLVNMEGVAEVSSQTSATPLISKFSGTPLMIAIVQSYLYSYSSYSTYYKKDLTPIIELLLETGADPNLKDLKHGDTALILAAREKKNITEILLKYGADPNIQNKTGRTALMDAAESIERKCNPDVVGLLLEHGTDITLKTTGKIKYDVFGVHGQDSCQHFLDLALGVNNFIFDTDKLYPQDNFTTPLEILKIINNKPPTDTYLRIIIGQTLTILKKLENETNSNNYRNAARILYTLARRIAQDYVLTFQHSSGKALYDLELPIFVESFNSQLNNLEIVAKNGRKEHFVNIVAENVDKILHSITSKKPNSAQQIIEGCLNTK